MDSTTLENNTNTQNQTILGQPVSLELLKAAPELKQAVPVKPDKPKPTYKCLVCGKSWVFSLLFCASIVDLHCWIFCSRLKLFCLKKVILMALIGDFFRYSKKTSLFTHHKTHPEHCVHCGENRGSSVENIYEHNLKHVNIRP